jgi:hypothetical protein
MAQRRHGAKVVCVGRLLRQFTNQLPHPNILSFLSFLSLLRGKSIDVALPLRLSFSYAGSDGLIVLTVVDGCTTLVFVDDNGREPADHKRIELSLNLKLPTLKPLLEEDVVTRKLRIPDSNSRSYFE